MPISTNAAPLARHDPEFEVTWYSDGSVREGSQTDGFRIVRLAGYNTDLIYRAAELILRDRRAKDGGNTRR